MCHSVPTPPRAPAHTPTACFFQYTTELHQPGLFALTFIAEHFHPTHATLPACRGPDAATMPLFCLLADLPHWWDISATPPSGLAIPSAIPPFDSHVPPLGGYHGLSLVCFQFYPVLFITYQLHCGPHCLVPLLHASHMPHPHRRCVRAVTVQDTNIQPPPDCAGLPGPFAVPTIWFAYVVCWFGTTFCLL